MDAFAKPTFQLYFDDAHPISSTTALELLSKHGDGSSISAAKNDSASSAGEISRYRGADTVSDGSEGEADQAPYQVYLHRTSPSALHLCSVPHPKPSPKEDVYLNESALREHRHRIVTNALKLLSPLKDTCLFYTLDWFTYSLCYGDAIKQFRALPRAAGSLSVPAMDPNEHSYVLGRWNEEMEAAKEGEEVSDLQAAGAAGDELVYGTELMELVHFSLLDSGPSLSSVSNVEGDSPARSQTSFEGKGRYISQVWTDGTRCNINNELRSTEVQFHCAKSPAMDRISLVKEVTTCQYVVVVDTPKLCREPALAQVEDEVRQIRCQPVVSEEELQNKQKLTTSIGGKKESEIQAEPTAQVAAADKENVRQGEEVRPSSRDDIKATIESMIARLSEAAGGQFTTDTVEVAVVFDENGKLIIQPRAEGSESDVERLLDNNFAADSPEASKSKWELLFNKLLDLEDQIFNAADAEDFGVDDNRRTFNNDESTGQQRTVEKQGPPPTTMTKKDAIDPAAVATPKQMIREKESFAQKADRYYKAVEEQRKAEATKEGEEEAGKSKEDKEHLSIQGRRDEL